MGQGISMIERQGSIITVYQYRYGIIPRSVSPYDPSSGEKPIGFDNNGQKSESIFARPAVLSRLAHFILEIQVSIVQLVYFIILTKYNNSKRVALGQEKRLNR